MSEISFNALVLSLATSAAMHFGDVADPVSGLGATSNLEAGVHMIEILALLEEKTSGNLTDEEKSFLVQVLYEPRMRYVESKKGEKRIIEP